MHMGGVYGMLIDERLAHQSGGVFCLRIEDTDTARTVPGAVDVIVAVASKLGLKLDEGAISETDEKGNYGPYTQSKRKDIYHSVAAELLASGRAYPCFLSPEEMEQIRERQKADGFPTGIYGEFARDRDLTESEIIAHLDAGKIPSIRLYSTGDPNKKIYCKDLVRGSIAFPENNEDIVIIKSGDGLPTYHFAHLVDDHFMRITHIIRAEEWLPSLPLHVQMFNMMGWMPLPYYHTVTIDKLDDQTGNRRKLSKRKDPEASIAALWKLGWAGEPVLEYLFNLIASGYEEAKMKNPRLTMWDYPINIKKMPSSGALFDMKKLEWWAKEWIATLSVDELTARVVAWANEYSPDWKERLNRKQCDNSPPQGGSCSALPNYDYLRAQLAIERDPPVGAAGNPARIRKDFITWKQTLESVAFFWDDLFNEQCTMNNEQLNLIRKFLETYNYLDDKDTWWNKIKEVASMDHGLSADGFAIKPGDVAMALRIAVTGRSNTPDLYSVMQVLGDGRVRARIENSIKG
jgi:glutamyl-tRNA synthetase